MSFENLEDKQAILCIVKPDKYLEFVESFTRDYLDKDFSCYVSLSRPYNSLIGTFDRLKIDTESIFFIDTSTKLAGDTDKQAENCLFIESPSALTSLSIAMNKVIEASNPKYIFFDSLSTLLIYNPEKMIIKFTRDLINSVRGTDSKIIFVCLDGKDEMNILEKTSLFVDDIEKI